VGRFKCFLLTDIIPSAVNDFLILAKTPFECCILKIRVYFSSLLSQERYPIAVALTWESTKTSSFVMWRSVSIACTPDAAAPINALIVFSGWLALNPRCAMVNGSFSPVSRFLANVHDAIVDS